MIITFAGHSETIITPQLKNIIKLTIKQNIKYKNTTFYCGGYGNFDYTVATILNEFKKEFPNIKIVLVTPYITGNRLELAKESRLYDSIVYPDLEKIPLRFAITKRNEYMIDCADLLITYVEHNWGGAYNMLMLAKKKNKLIINLADDIK